MAALAGTQDKLGEGLQLLQIKIGAGSWITMACLNKVDVNTDADKEEIVCVGTGGKKQATPGLIGLTIDLGGILRNYSTGDLTTNAGGNEIAAALDAKTECQVRIGTAFTASSIVQTFTGYFYNSNHGREAYKNTNWSAQFGANEWDRAYTIPS